MPLAAAIHVTQQRMGNSEMKIRQDRFKRQQNRLRPGFLRLTVILLKIPRPYRRGKEVIT